MRTKGWLSKKENETTLTRTTHVHQYTPSPAMEIAVKFLAVLILGFLGWHTGVFLLEQAGIRESGETLAWLIVAILFILPLNWLFNTYWLDWLSHKEKMEDKKTEQLRYKQIMAQSIVADSRQIGPRARLVNLVCLVIMAAYNHHTQSGQFRGTWRPWSRREIQKLTPADGLKPSEREATEVKDFLLKNNVITGRYPNEQLNTEQFPDIASVQRLLYYPLTIQNPDALPATTNTERSVID